MPTNSFLRQDLSQVKSAFVQDVKCIFQSSIKSEVMWFRASAAMQMRSAFFWGITQRQVVNPYRLNLDNDQLNKHLLYFTICLLWSSTCCEQYMLTIRRMNFIDAASGVVTLSKWPSGAQVERFLSQPVHRTVSYWEWRYQMLHQYNSFSWWWAYNAQNM